MNYGLWTLSRDCVLHNQWKQQIGITSLPILMQNCSGGDNVLLGRNSLSLTPWYYGAHQYLLESNSLNEMKGTVGWNEQYNTMKWKIWYNFIILEGKFICQHVK